MRKSSLACAVGAGSGTCEEPENPDRSRGLRNHVIYVVLSSDFL